MENREFVLNNIFEQKAKVYQTRPVRAMKYEKGIETGYVVGFTNIPTERKELNIHEGLKFFDTEAEAWDYINSNPDQYINVDGELIQVDVEYETPLPILHRKVSSSDERVGFRNCNKEKYAFISNEAEQYDFFYLDSSTCDNPIWIIQGADGGVRVWEEGYPECCGETFFGKENELIYEKVAEDKYVQVVM